MHAATFNMVTNGRNILTMWSTFSISENKKKTKQMQNSNMLQNGGNIDSGDEHFEQGKTIKKCCADYSVHSKIKVKRLQGATLAAQVEQLSINGILSGA